MRLVRYRSSLPVPASMLFAWHARPGAFERLLPPWQKIDIVQRDGNIRDGDLLALDIRLDPVRIRWLARHVDFVDGVQFRDLQVDGPFRHWSHTHIAVPSGSGRSILEDRIEYELPLPAVSGMLNRHVVQHEIRRMFRFRHLRTRNDLKRHYAYSLQPRVRVGIAGSGRICAQLAAFLRGGGHTIVESGQADFVVDLTRLVAAGNDTQIDVRPDQAWIAVAPRNAPATDSLRWPRVIQVQVPVVVSESLPGLSRRIACRFGAVPNSNAPWIAEDDLIGVIHHLLLSGESPETVTVRAPTLAPVNTLCPFSSMSSLPIEVFGSTLDFPYMYSTLSDARRMASGLKYSA